jgi:hypothetical protein
MLQKQAVTWIEVAQDHAKQWVLVLAVFNHQNSLTELLV